MKAKIKATGEVAEIIGEDQDAKTGEYKRFLLNSHIPRWFNPDEVELIGAKWKINFYLPNQNKVPTFEDIPIPRVGEHIHYKRQTYKVTLVEYYLDDKEVDIFTTTDL